MRNKKAASLPTAKELRFSKVYIPYLIPNLFHAMTERLSLRLSLRIFIALACHLLQIDLWRRNAALCGYLQR